MAGGEVETILAWSADRLSRNFAHQMLLQEEFARHGARIVFVQEPDDATPQGMLLRQMLSAISEYERTQIAERSRRGKIHRARQGSLNMISRPPYGYRLIRKTEACGARLEIDEAEAAVVRRIYDLYVREGLKMHAVSRRLDAEGIRPRHAECWPTATGRRHFEERGLCGEGGLPEDRRHGQTGAPQPHRQAQGGDGSAPDRARRAPSRGVDRVARSGHRRGDRLRPGTTAAGGESALLAAQDGRSDAAPRALRVR